MTPETTAAVETSKATAIIEREKQYLLQNYGRYPLAVARGRGSYMFGVDGKKYLDLITGIGVNALGHAHPRLQKVIREQAKLLIHCSNLYYHEYQGLLAEKIAKVSGLSRCFFCNSGTEAMEGALKMVHSHGRQVSPQKFEIVSLDNSFHGRTMGALSITGQQKYREDFEPLIPGVRFVPINNISALESAVNENTAGIVLEIIQGEGGIYPASEAFARKAKELSERFNALLVFDEIQCGVGRRGTYFGYQSIQPPILPDVMVAAKPLAAGLPLGVIACNERAAGTIKAGMHGSTFGGGALACRLAVEFFDILEDLLPQIRARSDYFRHKLQELATRYAFIKEARVHGLMIGVELKMPGKQLVLDAMEQGLLINCTHDVVLRFLPPYTISEAEIDKATRILNKVFRKGKQYYKEFLAKPAEGTA
jgi:acetylornithine/N-succinyldiaminopimelate aminotransferase